MKSLLAVTCLLFFSMAHAGIIYNKTNGHEMHLTMNENSQTPQLEVNYYDGDTHNVIPLNRIDIELVSGRRNVDESFSPVLNLSKKIDAIGDEDQESPTGIILLGVLPFEICLLPITLSAELIQNKNLASDMRKIRRAIIEKGSVEVSKRSFQRILRILKVDSNKKD